MSRKKLFCFPYAGGSAMLYHRWQAVAGNVELIPVELTGRGRRINEPLYDDVQAMVADMYRCVTAQIQDDEFAFFGHSMGSMIAYELTLALRKNGERLPIHNFFSGRAAPHTPCEQSNLHLLSDDAFKEALLRLGGTPAQFFEYPELMETFYPLLRNDFMLAQTDFSERPIAPLDTDITVFFGSDEVFSDEAMMGWRKHTDKCCSLHVLRGDHFFLHHQMPRMLHIIRQTLQQSMMDVEPALPAYPDVAVVR